MVSLDTLQTLLKLRDPGYSSVYMFDEQASKEITERGHSQGLKQYEVASDHLLMDIDSGEEGLRQVQEVLGRLNLKYEVWSSGGKGFHVILKHPLICSKHLPYSHKKWVEGVGLGTVVDTTIYQHGRLISLPGRVHPKTKKRKELVSCTDGYELDLPIIEEPATKFELNVYNDLELLAIGLTRFADMVNTPPTPGHRHTKLWGTAKDLAAAGLAFETVLDIAQRVNETWEHQKSPKEVEAAIAQAFKTR